MLKTHSKENLDIMSAKLLTKPSIDSSSASSVSSFQTTNER